MFLYQIVVVGK